MKCYILLVTLLIIVFSCWSTASSDGDLEERKTTAIVEQIGTKLKSVWHWFWNRGKSSFAERCFGVARKLRFVIPLVVFTLGVIVTILGFLSVFSLKTLGLLTLLLMLNSAGIAKLGHSSPAKANSVHFHLHPQDFMHSSSYPHFMESHHGWHDKQETVDLDSLEERLRKLRLYEEFYKRQQLL